MLQFFIIFALFFYKEALTQSCEADDQYSWSYHGPDNGPNDWVKDYPDCGKKFQSPIAISSKHTVNLGYILKKLDYNGFNTPITKAKFINLGWTVIVIPEDDNERYIEFEDQKYILDEIHFHFGTTDNPGAEHVLHGIRHEMEIHYVTHQDENESKVAVVASLMKAGDQHNAGLDPIIEVLPQLQYRNDSTELESQLNLAGLLPQDSGSYYYYVGSNAIPPCEPGYEWWVLKDIGKVGNDQLDEFMTVYSVEEDNASDSCLMGPNFRPLQGRDGRLIYGSE